jgi:hypothetical protein
MELLREQRRTFEAQLAVKDEQIQKLLDRIQHPDRTPIWREAPDPLPDLETADGWQSTADFQTDPSDW